MYESADTEGRQLFLAPDSSSAADSVERVASSRHVFFKCGPQNTSSARDFVRLPTASCRGEIPTWIFLIIYIMSVFVLVTILLGRTDLNFVIITSGKITAVVINVTLC
jgi:hypothetical protein